MTLSLSRYVESIAPSGIRKFFDLVVSQQDIISLGVGEPDFATPWAVCDEAIYCLEQGQTSYTSNKGLLSCRSAIADYMATQFFANYDPETEIIVTNGVSEAVDLVFRSLLNPGDEVLLPEPTYVCYRPLIQLTGAVVVPMDTTATALIPDPKVIESKITAKTKAIVLCSPNNPTGRIIPKTILKKIVDIARRHHIWIISDEIYAELDYTDTFQSVGIYEDIRDRCVVLNGFSKTFAMTGWRIGYICGPGHLVASALKIHQYSALCASIMAQYAAIEALKSRRDVVKMKQSYQARRNYVLSELARHGIPVHAPEGAFYCFPNISQTGLSSEDFCLQFIEEQKVAAVPGSVFGLGGEGHIRICYATALDQLKVAMDRLGNFYHKKISK